MQQLENQLLLLVGLGQGGNAGLLQDGVARQVRHRRGNVGRRDGVFRRRQVRDLVADDVAGALQPVNAGADIAARESNSLNRTVDVGECGFGIRRREQINEPARAA